jgi:hypothetical protein
VRRLCWDPSSHTACVFAVPWHQFACVRVSVGWWNGWWHGPFAARVCLCKEPCGWLASCRAVHGHAPWFGDWIRGVSQQQRLEPTVRSSVLLCWCCSSSWGCCWLCVACNCTPLKPAACVHLSQPSLVSTAGSCMCQYVSICVCGSTSHACMLQA